MYVQQIVCVSARSSIRKRFLLMAEVMTFLSDGALNVFPKEVRAMVPAVLMFDAAEGKACILPRQKKRPVQGEMYARGLVKKGPTY